MELIAEPRTCACPDRHDCVHSVTPLRDLVPIASQQTLDLPGVDWPAFNPCIYERGRGFHALVRTAGTPRPRSACSQGLQGPAPTAQ